MSAPTEIMIVSAIVAVGPGVVLLLNEKRKRKLAEARLALAKLATDANRQMRSGETTKGDICHDKVYKWVLSAQQYPVFTVDWNPLKRVTPEAKSFQEELGKELRAHPNRASLVDSFTANLLKAFRTSHPLKFRLFWFWVIFFRGGLAILGAAIRLAIFGARGMLALHEGWKKCTQNVKIWALLYNIHGDPDYSDLRAARFPF